MLGGAFLFYKSISEVHTKLEGVRKNESSQNVSTSFWGVIIQIVALDVIFSFDSVLTAVGMISFKDFGYSGAMAIMICAIIIAVFLMIAFSGPISRFVNNHPTIQMLALSFLLLISIMLLLEAGHLAQITIWGHTIQEIPKGYIYFAIAFSLLVEMLNMKLNKSGSKESRK